MRVHGFGILDVEAWERVSGCGSVVGLEFFFLYLVAITRLVHPSPWTILVILSD